MNLSRLRLGPLQMRGWRRVGAVTEESGAAAVEFALMLPVLCLLMFGIIKLGLAFNNYIQLTNAAAAGSRQLSISRPSSTPATTTPYTSTIAAITSAAPNLSSTALTSGATLKVSGASCSSDSSCNALLTDAGLVAQVSLTYSCDLNIFNLIHSCGLAASASGLVQ